MKKISRLVDKYEADIIKTTRELIQIKSVEEKAEKDSPFGPGVRKVLEYFLDRARNLGLKTRNVDNYGGHVEIGQGEEILAVLCHLDVVPAGDNWTQDPFGGELKDDKIFGRGAIDNKGPAATVLYSLKALEEAESDLNKRVRLILGTDEESGWQGLDYYLQQEENPDMAFSPDASFPVIHAEKGILVFSLNKTFSGDQKKHTQKSNLHRIISIKGGNAPNMVPDSCQAILKSAKPEKLQTIIKTAIENCNFDLELIAGDNGDFLLKSYGSSAHGSMPEEGQNAISQLMVFLSELDIFQGEIIKLVQFYQQYIGMEYNGESLGCNLTDEISGKLIFNVGMVDINRQQAKIIINVRYPVTFVKKDIYSRIQEKIRDKKIIIEELEYFAPLHMPINDPLVENLMQVYEKITGEKSTPKAIGGGTYARALENSVAFGPRFPGRPKLAHQADEYIKISDLIDCARIYTAAIYNLAH